MSTLAPAAPVAERKTISVHVRQNPRASWDHGSRSRQVPVAADVDPLEYVRLHNEVAGWAEVAVFVAGRFVTK